ncbi:hypothetical protein B0H67DRAFT_567873 [Lasiosphaeris hirsuta]|uniref:Rhodopsin domain-containing protein n=1 Tax=Lasiosphaeris hirsuta TaxID=260670 RepID=A0AA40AYN9_9PEZI|nr:hypothetical protein B0H67DRAFT_567873 [Lasiosphaeris hirsuta]
MHRRRDGGISRNGNDSVGPRTLVILLPLFALALAVYLARMWTRVGRRCRLNAADYMITAATISETFSIVLTAVAVANGFGRHVSALTTDSIETIGAATFAAAFFGFAASCASRISVACLLLQFTQSRAWRMILWMTVAFQALLFLGCELVITLQCRPIRAKWANVPGARCISAQENWIMGYVFISIAMFSDVVFAIFPILLVWRLSRSLVERLLLSALLGLGLLGVIAGAVKIVTLKYFKIGSENVVADMMPVYLWSRIEEIVIIAAACVPLLKAPIENLLYLWFGIRFYPTVRDLDTTHTSPPFEFPREGAHCWWHGGSEQSSQQSSSTGRPAEGVVLEHAE